MQQLHHRLLHRTSSRSSCIISSFSFFSVPKGGRGHVGSLRLLSTTSSSSSSFSTSTTPAPSATPLDPAVQSTVLTACADLHSSILPLNDRLRGPLGASAGKGSDSTSLPFVLLVGNHSSGKSSFINHVLGRPVQTAGVAPTDDSFTVIAPGPSDVDTGEEYNTLTRPNRARGGRNRRPTNDEREIERKERQRACAANARALPTQGSSARQQRSLLLMSPLWLFPHTIVLLRFSPSLLPPFTIVAC